MTNAEQARKQLETIECEHKASQERLQAARQEAESTFESIARSKEIDDKSLAKLTTARAKSETAAAVVDRLASEVARARAALVEAEHADRVSGVRALHQQIRAKSEELDRLAAKAKASLSPGVDELAALVERAGQERSRLPREAFDLVADARALTAWTERAAPGRHPLSVAAEVEARQEQLAQVARDMASYRREIEANQARLRRPAAAKVSP